MLRNIFLLQVCITNDPRPQNPYNKLYTVDYLGNVHGGRKVLYINQPVDVLKKLAIKTIADEKKVKISYKSS